MIAFALAVLGSICAFIGTVFNDGLPPGHPLTYLCPLVASIACVMSYLSLFTQTFA